MVINTRDNIVIKISSVVGTCRETNETKRNSEIALCLYFDDTGSQGKWMRVPRPRFGKCLGDTIGDKLWHWDMRPLWLWWRCQLSTRTPGPVRVSHSLLWRDFLPPHRGDLWSQADSAGPALPRDNRRKLRKKTKNWKLMLSSWDSYFPWKVKTLQASEIRGFCMIPLTNTNWCRTMVIDNFTGDQLCHIKPNLEPIKPTRTEVHGRGKLTKMAFGEKSNRKMRCSRGLISLVMRWAM